MPDVQAAEAHADHGGGDALAAAATERDRAARLLAAASGEGGVIPDDVNFVAVLSAGGRWIMSRRASCSGSTDDARRRDGAAGRRQRRPEQRPRGAPPRSEYATREVYFIIVTFSTVDAFVDVTPRSQPRLDGRVFTYAGDHRFSSSLVPMQTAGSMAAAAARCGTSRIGRWRRVHAACARLLYRLSRSMRRPGAAGSREGSSTSSPRRRRHRPPASPTSRWCARSACGADGGDVRHRSALRQAGVR